MKIGRIEYSLNDDKRIAQYQSDGVVGAPDFPNDKPVLIIEVADEDDATEIVNAIEKLGRTPKSRKRKTKSGPVTTETSIPLRADGDKAETPAVGAIVPAAGKETPKCPIEGCRFDVDEGGLCRDHLKAQGKQRARALGEKLREVTG